MMIFPFFVLIDYQMTIDDIGFYHRIIAFILNCKNMQEQDQNSQSSSPKLDLKLITPEYYPFQREPEQYLMVLIRQNNPWPTAAEATILAFLQDITKLYKKVSYHNVTHAFDVMTSFHQYLERYSWKSKLYLTQQKKILMLIAAYAHDSGHEGLTNAYYKNSGHSLSLGSVSPLQSMHAGNLKGLFRKYQLSVAGQLEQELVEMILKTDNFYHGWLIDKLNSLKSIKGEQFREKDNALTMSCILLHAADLNNAAKDFQLSVRWTNQLYIQFQSQARLQTVNDLPVSFVKPSSGLEYIDSNISFLEHMILPLFRGICELQSSFLEILKRIENNKQHWAVMRQSEKLKQEQGHQ